MTLGMMTAGEGEKVDRLDQDARDSTLLLELDSLPKKGNIQSLQYLTLRPNLFGFTTILIVRPFPSNRKAFPFHVSGGGPF